MSKPPCARALVALCLAPLALCRADVREDGTRLVVRGREATVVLDKEKKGAIASLVDSATGQEFAAQHERPALFVVAVSPAGEGPGTVKWLSSLDAQTVAYAVGMEGGREVARITYGRVGGHALTVVCTVSLDPEDGAMLWGFEVRGPASLVLEEVGYPVVPLRASLEGGGEAFVAGTTKGGVMRAPGRWGKGKLVGWAQPGSLAAQFACYYNARAGVYTATRDARGFPKMLQFRRTGWGLELSWRHYGFHRLDEPFALGYDVALATFGGSEADAPTDWRHAADLYKRWALRQPWCARRLDRRDDLPEWLRQGPAMVRFSRQWLARPERIEAWLRDYWRPRFPGVPLIVAFWGWEGVAPWVSPKYFPPFPSEEGLRRAIDAVRSVGGHPFFWPSGYEWNVTYGKRADGSFEHDDRADFEKTARPHTVTNRDGSPFIRSYRWLQGGANAALCRGDPWTRRWLNDIAVELTRRGADLIQIDQVVGAGARGGGRCYSASHGHPPGPGLWDSQAFGEQLRTMRAACKALDRNVVLGFEEPQELFIHQIGIQDCRDAQVQWQPRAPGHVPAPVFGYLYHEFLPCFQSNPRAGDARMLAYCIVSGQVPHLVPHWPIGPSPALRNGAFAEWNGDVPDGWSHVKGYRGKSYGGVPHRDDAARHRGAASLRLDSRKAGDIAQVSQNVPIGPDVLVVGKRYRLSLWFKARELAAGNRILLGAFDPAWKAKGSWSIPLAASAEWRRGEVAFTIPEGAVRLRIMLHVVGPSTVWLDDLALDEACDDGGFRTAMRQGAIAEHALAAEWVRLFHGEGRPYLLMGRMLRPPRLRAEPPQDTPGSQTSAILCNAYRAPDGSEAVVAVNATGQPQRCVLDWGGEAIRLGFRPWELKLLRGKGKR